MENQVCTNRRRQATRPTESCAVAPYVVGSPLWNLRDVTITGARICGWLLIHGKRVYTSAECVFTSTECVYTCTKCLLLQYKPSHSMNVTQTSVRYQKSKFVMFGSRQ